MTNKEKKELIRFIKEEGIYSEFKDKVIDYCQRYGNYFGGSISYFFKRYSINYVLIWAFEYRGNPVEKFLCYTASIHR